MVKNFENKSKFAEVDRQYLKCLSTFYEGNLDETCSVLSHVLKLDPEHKWARAMQIKTEKLLVDRIEGITHSIILLQFYSELTNT